METAEMFGGIVVGFMAGVILMGAAQCVQNRRDPCDMCGSHARVYIEQSVRMCPECTARMQELYRNNENDRRAR